MNSILFLFNKLAGLQSRSLKATRAFRSLIKDLTETNIEITKEIKVRVDKAKLLKLETDVLSELHYDNTAFIEKVEEFLKPTPKKS